MSTLNAVIVGGLIVLALHYYINGDLDKSITATLMATGWVVGMLIALAILHRL